jgi:hypothetical protein
MAVTAILGIATISLGTVVPVSTYLLMISCHFLYFLTS